MRLQLSGTPGKGWQWRMDAQALGRASHETLWRPMPGRHRLSLLDANDSEIESVSFEVRALRGKRAK